MLAIWQLLGWISDCIRVHQQREFERSIMDSSEYRQKYPLSNYRVAEGAEDWCKANSAGELSRLNYWKWANVRMELTVETYYLEEDPPRSTPCFMFLNPVDRSMDWQMVEFITP